MNDPLRPSVLSFGEVLWDQFPGESRFGGAPANVACHCSLSGAESCLISAVGADAPGRQALEILSQYGVDTSGVSVLSEAPTGSVGVRLLEGGKPEFTIHPGSAWDQIPWVDRFETLLWQSDAIVYGTLGQRSQVSRQTLTRVLERASQLGKWRVLDVNLRAPFFDDALIERSVAAASFLKMSDEELPTVARACGVSQSAGEEATLRALSERFELDGIAMTCGAKGAVLLYGTTLFEQSSFPVEVVDTVGAGDSFTAVLLCSLLRREDPLQALRAACQTASGVCGIRGALPEPKTRTTGGEPRP
jgi:fructokinase